MQDNDLNIEDFKEIFLKALFINDDLNPTATIEEMADYFELESFKFMKKNSDDSLSQKLKDLVLKKFINGIEKAKIEVSEPFIEHEQRHLFNIWQSQAQGNDVSGIDKPSRYNLSIPISNVSNRLGGRLELWVVDSIYQGFELFKQQRGVAPQNDNQWIKDLVKGKYKYYGFEEHIGLDYDFQFMEHKNGDIDFNNQKWASVNWYIRNLNTLHRDLLNNLEMLPKEKVKEQIMFAYNKQIEVFQDWDLRQGVYVEYYNTMEEVSKLSGSRIPNGYYDVYRLKWLFISACFMKFYKVILDKYFSEQPKTTASPTKGKPQKQQTGFNLGYSETQLKALHKALIDATILDNQTNEAHFINAFNGLPLINFERLKWVSPTYGAIFCDVFKKTEKVEWIKINHLFISALYSKLLSQSKKFGSYYQTEPTIKAIKQNIL